MLAWAFVIQAALAVAGVLASGWLSRQRRAVVVGACIAGLAAMLLWPLMRFFPTVAIDLLGAQATACIEITGLMVPAALVFSVAARRVPKASDRRAILVLVAVAGAYFAWSGRWMLWYRLPDLGPTQMHGSICKQSTDYTCVAASLVTLLRARGIQATEQEMAERAFVQVGGGATDSRALWALERTLLGTRLHAKYATMDLASLIAAEKPTLVQLDFSYFVSHMVPVMSATASEVTIGDPLTGLRTVPIAEFMRRWKRQAIIVSEIGDR